MWPCEDSHLSERFASSLTCRSCFFFYLTLLVVQCASISCRSVAFGAQVISLRSLRIEVMWHIISYSLESYEDHLALLVNDPAFLRNFP